MSDILHRIQIGASPQEVYDAITTSEGLSTWWTTDSTHERSIGSVAEFGFHNRAVVFRMRVDELEPGKRVAWECLGDDPEWKGTRVTFDLTRKDDETVLDFTHSGWKSVEQAYPSCNAVWGFLMHNLKSVAEGKPTKPYFAG